MDTNGYIHLYTTLFGWQFYNVIWSILVGTGLVFLPVLGVILDGVLGARSSGSLLSVNADAALSQIEVNVFLLMLVIGLAAVPTGVTTISGSTLGYEGASVGSTESTYDETFGASPLASASVKIPVWWYGAMAISEGITKAVVEETGNENAFRELKRSLNIAAIREPTTRYLLQIFDDECHTPARSQFYDNMDATAVDARAGNLHWRGSPYFLDTAGYYDTIRTKTMLADFAFDAATNTEYSGDPGKGGTPTCTQLWTTMSADIYTQAEIDGVVGSWEKFWGIDEDEKAKIVQKYVETAEQRAIQSADEINAMRNGEQGAFESVVNWVSGQASNIGLGLVVLFLEAMVNAIVYGASTIQAYLLMAIYLFIPIGMLASRYSIAFLISGALLIFSVIFWTALWAIAAQADLFLAGSFWNLDSSDVVMAAKDPENVTKKLVHSIVILMLYTALPAAVSWVLMAAGSSAGMAIGQAARGMATGANAGNSAIGRGMGQVGTSAVKMVRKGDGLLPSKAIPTTKK